MSLYELVFGPSAETIKKHHEAFKPHGENPHDRKRTVSMQVLALGFSRTGTASMCAALTTLGYETYHGLRVLADARDLELWNPALETKYEGRTSAVCPDVNKAFFDKAVGHCSAVTDIPCCLFWRELIEVYPDAKVVLVQRDEQSWYKSFEDVMIRALANPVLTAVAWLEPKRAGAGIVGHRKMMKGYFNAPDAATLRRNAIPTSRKHYENIRELLKRRGEYERRCLEYSLDEGWEPLCEFLGKDVPRSEFPRVNETEHMNEKIRVISVIGFRTAVGKILGYAVYALPVLFAVGTFWWRHNS